MLKDVRNFAFQLRFRGSLSDDLHLVVVVCKSIPMPMNILCSLVYSKILFCMLEVQYSYRAGISDKIERHQNNWPIHKILRNLSYCTNFVK